ncbi:hypothetical protein CGRA01v4_01746 [Colletotrichum graminicola]|nr:hypothetical protein CGRA01v4_01746 [Colletotrichum graminicola]
MSMPATTRSILSGNVSSLAKNGLILGLSKSFTFVDAAWPGVDIIDRGWEGIYGREAVTQANGDRSRFCRDERAKRSACLRYASHEAARMAVDTQRPQAVSASSYTGSVEQKSA